MIQPDQCRFVTAIWLGQFFRRQRNRVANVIATDEKQPIKQVSLCGKFGKQIVGSVTFLS